MGCFLLIHGAFHGGWCWDLLADQLRDAGHRVYAPSLTGLGDRSHLSPQDVILDTHIEDVCAVIESRELHSITLVGHSYGGMPMTGAADRMPERIRNLIYLDAMVPENGKSALAIRYPSDSPFPPANSDGVIPPISARAFNVFGELGEWVDRQLTPQPAMTVTQPIALDGNWNNIPTKVYVRAKAYEAPWFDRFFDELSLDPTWDTYQLPWGHDMMITNPNELAELLMSHLNSSNKWQD